MIPVTLQRRQLPRPGRNPVSRDSQAPEWTTHLAPPARRARPAGQASGRMPPRASVGHPRRARDRRCPAHRRAARESVPCGGIPAPVLLAGAAPRSSGMPSAHTRHVAGIIRRPSAR